VLEKIIVKILYSKLGLKYENNKNFVFIDHLKNFKTIKEEQNDSEHFEPEQLPSACSASQFDATTQQFNLNQI